MKAKKRIIIMYKLFLKNLLNISSNPLYQIIGIFLLALILRIFKLGDFPVGFHVDEVKVGWNALSILHTLRDDHNNLLPLYYNTFGDYRPTGIFYLSMPLIALFGNSIFAVRLTSALFGALTVIPVYLLGKEIFRKENAGIYAGFILAISPWHIEVSRATSEVAISAFFILFSIYYLIKLINKNNNKYLYLSILSIIVSYSLYHSARILLPIYLLIVLAYYFSSKLNRKNITPVVFSIILTLLISFGSQSRERLKQVSIFNSENIKYELTQSKEPKFIVYSRNIIEEYGKYFSTDFLTGESAKPYRYLTLGVGLLNYIDLLLLVFGIYLIIKSKKYWIIPLLLLISPLAAILTVEDSPNLHRSFYMILFISMIEGYALSQIKNLKIIFGVLGASLLYFIFSYFLKSNLHIPYQKNLYIDSPTYRNIGNIELSIKIFEYQDSYDYIYVTNFPDNLYPWYAFLNKVNPKEFNTKSLIQDSNERRYENIIFTDTKCPSDYVKSSKTLIIDSGECPIENKIKDGLKATIIDEIKRSDNSTVYYLLNSK